MPRVISYEGIVPRKIQIDSGSNDVACLRSVGFGGITHTGPGPIFPSLIQKDSAIPWFITFIYLYITCTVTETGSNDLMNIWRAYTNALQRNPYRVQIGTSAVLWLVGDVLAQHTARRTIQTPQAIPTATASTDNLDWARSMHHAMYGGLVNGTVGHLWYQELDKLALRWFQAGTPRFVAAKVAGDGLVFGPLHVSGYMMTMSLIEGASIEEAKKTLRDNFGGAYLVELVGWSLVQSINFRFVPVTHHLLVVNLVTVADAAFMSWWLNRHPRDGGDH